MTDATIVLTISEFVITIGGTIAILGITIAGGAVLVQILTWTHHPDNTPAYSWGRRVSQKQAIQDYSVWLSVPILVTITFWILESVPSALKEPSPILWPLFPVAISGWIIGVVVVLLYKPSQPDIRL